MKATESKMETITATGTSGNNNNRKLNGTDYEAECKVIIIQKVTAITANDITVAKMKQQNSSNNNPMEEDLTYTSGNTKWQIVAEDGTVTGLSEGNISNNNKKEKYRQCKYNMWPAIVTKKKEKRLSANRYSKNKNILQ